MFSSFTGNLSNSSYSKSGSFSRGQAFTFLAQRNHVGAILSRHSTSSLTQIVVDVPLPSPTSDAPESTEDDSSSMQQLLLDQ
jgi:hypothetical protein